MRAGAHWRADSIEELEPLCEILDAHGASAIHAPRGFADWSPEQCDAFGRAASALGLVIGEAGYWQNLLGAPEPELRGHIETIRRMLVNGERMGLRCVVTLAGSFDHAAGPASVSSRNFSPDAQRRFREICLRIVDNLDLQITRYAPEPWHNGFYHQLDAIERFLADLNDERIGVHLDMANLITQLTYHDTGPVIDAAFDRLGERIVSVHAKDLHWDAGRMFLHIDEVYPGDGALDYRRFMRRLAALDPDLPVFVEHFTEDAQFKTAIVKLHQQARLAGVRFTARG